MLICKKHFAMVAPIVACVGLLLVPAAAQAAPHYYENGSPLPPEAGPPEKGNVPGKHPVIAWGPITLESPAAGKINCINVFYAYIWNPLEGGPGRDKVVQWDAFGCIDTHLEELTGIAHIYIDATPKFPLKGTTGAVAEGSMAGQRRGTSLPWKSELCGPVELNESSHPINRVGLIAYGEGGEAIEGANCLNEATPHVTACYPNATGPVTGHRWQEIVEPVGANTNPGVLVQGKGCIMLNFVIPEILAEDVFFGTNEAEWQEGGNNCLTPGRWNFHKLPAEGIPSGALESQEDALGHGATITAEGGEPLKLCGANGQQQIQVK